MYRYFQSDNEREWAWNWAVRWGCDFLKFRIFTDCICNEYKYSIFIINVQSLPEQELMWMSVKPSNTWSANQWSWASFYIKHGYWAGNHAWLSSYMKYPRRSRVACAPSRPNVDCAPSYLCVALLRTWSLTYAIESRLYYLGTFQSLAVAVQWRWVTCSTRRTHECDVPSNWGRVTARGYFCVVY